MARMASAPKVVVSPKRAAINATRSIAAGARVSQEPLTDDEHEHSIDRAVAVEKRRQVALVIQARKHGRAEGFRQADSARRIAYAWVLGGATWLCLAHVLRAFG